MSRGSPQLTEARKEEIIAACAALYEEKGFKETTIKEIGKAITLTRTGIYLYFETKEEIFLALLRREYDAWVSEMREIMAAETAMTRDGAAEALARTLTNHPKLLRLLSMLLRRLSMRWLPVLTKPPVPLMLLTPPPPRQRLLLTPLKPLLLLIVLLSPRTRRLLRSSTLRRRPTRTRRLLLRRPRTT